MLHGSTGHGYQEELASLAAEFQPQLVILHDPYIGALRRTTRLFRTLASAQLGHILSVVHAAGYVHASGLQRVEEFLEALSNVAPRVHHVRLRTRGELGRFGAAGVPIDAGGLLADWVHDTNARWRPRRIAVEIELATRVHTRRCVLQGPRGGCEIRWEWGLQFYIDDPANLQRSPSERRVMTTDVAIFQFAGGWADEPHDAEVTGESSSTALQHRSCVLARALEPHVH